MGAVFCLTSLRRERGTESSQFGSLNVMCSCGSIATTNIISRKPKVYFILICVETNTRRWFIVGVDEVNNKKNNGSPRESTEMNALQRPCTPAESLERSLKEMNEMRQGTIPKQTWNEFLKSLKEEEE